MVDPDARPAGGESLRDFYRRVAEFADELACAGADGWGPRAGDVAVVAHGGTLRVLTAYLRGIPVERMSWEPLANGMHPAVAGWLADHRSHEIHQRGKTDESDRTAPARAGRPSRAAPGSRW